MPINVLIVDDSPFFCKRLKNIINQDPHLHVIGIAANGLQAIELTQKLQPDIITMDIEMPIMDGISAVKKIMEIIPTPILMFSSLTYKGAQATLDAMDAGAIDFLPKRLEDIASNQTEIAVQLQQRLKKLVKKTTKKKISDNNKKISTESHGKDFTSSGKTYRLLMIGSSTGGPSALQKIITRLPANFPYPILLIQHMPASFTFAFAERLNHLSDIKVKEAISGDVLEAGTAYLASGGKQLLLKKEDKQTKLKVVTSKKKMNYKPCIDITFASATKIFADEILAVVLTGMGNDGCEGAKLLAKNNANIWVQDEISSVIYGMPQAIVKEGLASQIFHIDNMAQAIITEMLYG